MFKYVGRVILLILINLIPSIIIPFILAYFRLLSNTDSILLGALILILLTCGEVLYRVNEMYEMRHHERILLIAQRVNELYEMRHHERILLIAQDEIDMKLYNIGESFRRILSKKSVPTDLFEHFFEERINELETMITEAIERGELHQDRRHVVNVNIVLANFKGMSEDIFRATLFLRDIEFFFAWAKQYFYSIHVRLLEKKIKEIKRIIVYDDIPQMKDERSIRLINFHASNMGYSYRLMSMDDFVRLKADCRMSFPADFGIYGDKYVYRAKTNILDDVVGDYLNDRNVIEEYKSFFEICWNTPFARELKNINLTAPMTLEDLFQDTFNF